MKKRRFLHSVVSNLSKTGGFWAKYLPKMQDCEQFVTFEKKFEKIQKVLDKKRKIVYYIQWATIGVLKKQDRNLPVN